MTAEMEDDLSRGSAQIIFYLAVRAGYFLATAISAFLTALTICSVAGKS